MHISHTVPTDQPTPSGQQLLPVVEGDWLVEVVTLPEDMLLSGEANWRRVVQLCREWLVGASLQQQGEMGGLQSTPGIWDTQNKHYDSSILVGLET